MNKIAITIKLPGYTTLERYNTLDEPNRSMTLSLGKEDASALARSLQVAAQRLYEMIES
jgi:hypothetical protein